MRHFGVSEANRLVPVLQRAFTAIRPLAEELTDVTRRLREAPAGPEARASLAERRSVLLREIQALLDPLESLGVEVKSLDGLVDLRAVREGRTVYLCWRYGEEAIAFWHELHTGFGGRQPIEALEEFMPTFPS